MSYADLRSSELNLDGTAGTTRTLQVVFPADVSPTSVVLEVGGVPHSGVIEGSVAEVTFTVPHARSAQTLRLLVDGELVAKGKLNVPANGTNKPSSRVSVVYKSATVYVHMFPAGPPGEPGEDPEARQAAATAQAAAESAASTAESAPARIGTPGPLLGVTLTEDSPLPVDYFDGYVWGKSSTVSQIMRSADDGETWTHVATVTSGTGSLISLRPTGDGEVLAVITNGATSSGVHKSSGWSAASPGSATWSQVLDVNGSGAAFLTAWGFDGYGAKWIATHYASGGSWGDSRYVWISTDSGDTWTEVYDDGGDTDTHMHSVCYDRWSDRFFFGLGHGTNRGIYVSDDDGGTWTRIPGSDGPTGAPTVLTATDNGIVCGTDSDPSGIYVIERRDNIADMRLRLAWRWATGRDGTVGFAQRGFRDPQTGIVYVGFSSDETDVTAVVGASDGQSAAEVWRDPAGPSDNGRMYDQIVTANRVFLGNYRNSSGVHTLARGFVSRPGTVGQESNAVSASVGLTPSSSLAFGALAEAAGVWSTAVGVKASTGILTRSVAVGTSASVTGTSGIAIGYLSTTAGAGIAIGDTAAALGEGTAIGAGAATTGTGSTAIGRNAAAAGAAVAVGRGSNAAGTGTAVGYSANAAHGNAVALGTSSTSTAAFQVAIGPRHIETYEVATEPTAPAAGRARIYLVDNGGTPELRVRTAAGRFSFDLTAVP